MEEKKYKLYLASGIRLWNTDFKDKYAPFFNKRVDVFYPALIDDQYSTNHRRIPIKIATKDLGEINNRDAILAYMKMYDTNDNGPAGTDSSWECGYGIGLEKPTIMLVEDLEHLDYYTTQWMVTFSIGAILTTDKNVAEEAEKNDKFTHTTILYCTSKDQFENKIIEFLDNYYKSIYAREGIINYEVDIALREYASRDNILKTLQQAQEYKQSDKHGDKLAEDFSELCVKNKSFDNQTIHKRICALEHSRAQIAKHIIEEDFKSLKPFLLNQINICLENFENTKGLEDISEMISYWLSIPCEEIKGHRQGKKKTRPTIFFELYDLVSHHINMSDRYFSGNFVYKAGAIIEIYNWLNTYAIDDVFDNSETRQENETLHIKYKSRKNAFLLGTIGYCISLLYLYELTESKTKVCKEVVSTINNAQYLMYLGQPIDIDLSFRSSRELWKFVNQNNLDSALKKYFSRIYGICGAFYEEIGRMAVKATNVGAQFYNQEEAENACIYIAKLFGLVQMIRNDLGDLIFPEEMSDMSKGMKNTSHNDVMEGKLTLPIIYSIFNKHTNQKDRKILIKHIGNKRLNHKDKLEISRIIWESGSIEFCMQFIDQYCKLVSDEYIKYINETPTRLKWITKLMDITSLINISFRKLAINHRWRKLEPMISEETLLKEIQKLTNRSTFLEQFDKQSTR